MTTCRAHQRANRVANSCIHNNKNNRASHDFIPVERVNREVLQFCIKDEQQRDGEQLKTTGINCQNVSVNLGIAIRANIKWRPYRSAATICAHAMHWAQPQPCSITYRDTTRTKWGSCAGLRRKKCTFCFYMLNILPIRTPIDQVCSVICTHV